jgi:hypothetical protein
MQFNPKLRREDQWLASTAAIFAHIILTLKNNYVASARSDSAAGWRHCHSAASGMVHWQKGENP